MPGKRIYVTFSGAAYDETTRLIVERARDCGAHEVRVYDDRWLIEKTRFLQDYPWLFEPLPRYYNADWHDGPIKFGFGWCAWKPFIIQHALASLGLNDLLLYTDADTYPTADLLPLYRHTERAGMLLFEEQGCVNKVWTKRECLAEMNCDKVSHHKSVMACGRFQFFRGDSSRVRGLVQEWRNYSVRRNCQLWNISSGIDEYPEFRRHSCEQSVLSNLSYLYAVLLHRTPDQNGSGEKDRDLYPQVFEQRYCQGDRNDLSGSRYRNIV